MSQKTLPVLLTIVALMVFYSCKKEEKPRVTTKNELYVYLDSLERRYEAACSKFELAHWNKFLKLGIIDFETPRTELTKIFSDTTAHKIIEEWRNQSGSLADKLLARRLELWHRCFSGGVIRFDPEIIAFQNSFGRKTSKIKLKFNGSGISLQILNNLLGKEKKQSSRRKLWAEGQKISAGLESDYIRLVKMFNTKARTFGFHNYYSLLLYLQAIDEDWMVKTFNSMEEDTRTEYKKWLSSIMKKAHLKDFYPWDVEFIQPDRTTLPDRYFPADSIFKIIQRFEKGIGFDIDSLHVSETIGDASLDGACLLPSIPKDVRIILKFQKGVRPYKSGLFEHGKALRAVYTKVDYPILKGYNLIDGASSPAYRDGIGRLHEELLDDSIWLKTFTKVKERELKSYFSKLNSSKLFKLRKALKEFFTEYEIYKNPNQDLKALHRMMSEKYLLIDSVASEFYLLPHFLRTDQTPCVSHNLVISIMIASQLHEAWESKFGVEKFSNPSVAQWMIDHLFESGETFEWQERIRHATGKSLEQGAYLRKIGIDQSVIISKNKDE